MKKLRGAFALSIAVATSLAVWACSTKQDTASLADTPDGSSAGDAGGGDAAGGDTGGGDAGAGLGSTTATIGPDGGVISVAGITVTIPPGALTAPMAFTLTRFNENEMSLAPHAEFLIPVTVRFDGVSAQNRYALHRRDDGTLHELGEMFSDGNGAAFQASSFSCHYVASPKNVTLLSDGARDPKGWDEGDSLVGSDVANSDIPDGITEKDVTASCLTDVKDDKFPEDPITPAPGRTQDEAHLMTNEAAAALRRARNALTGPELGGYDLWLNGAWDSSGSLHSPNRDPEGQWDAPAGHKDFKGRLRDRHYYGAAIDVVLCKKTGETCIDASSKINDALLGKLADIMDVAGFDWVWWEPTSVCGGTVSARTHIHASISSPSVSKCVEKCGSDAGPPDNRCIVNCPNCVGGNLCCSPYDDGGIAASSCRCFGGAFEQ